MQIMKERKRIGNQASKIAFKYFFLLTVSGKRNTEEGEASTRAN